MVVFVSLRDAVSLSWTWCSSVKQTALVLWCLICLLTATALETAALRRGWSVSCIVIYSTLIHFLWLRCATFLSSSSSKPTLRPSSVVFQADSHTERIFLKSSDTREFNVEMFDITLPPAFLCILASVLPLAILQHALVTTTVPLTALSLLPAALLSVRVLVSRCYAIARQQPLRQASCSSFNLLRRYSSTVSAHLSCLHGHQFDAVQQQRHVASTDGHGPAFRSDISERPPPDSLQTLEDQNLVNQTSNVTLVLGPLSSEVLLPSNTLALFDFDEHRQLFGTTTDSCADPMPPPHFAFMTAGAQQTGWLSTCRDIVRECHGSLRHFCAAVITSASVVHITFLLLGCCIVALLANRWIISVSLVLYGVVVGCLKSALANHPFFMIRRMHPAVSEYNQILVECGLAILLGFLNLQQLLFETTFIRGALSWKIRSRGYWMTEWGVLLAATIVRLMANKSVQHLANLSSTVVVRWTELAFVLLWYGGAELYHSTSYTRTTQPPRLIQEYKLTSWGFGDTQARARSRFVAILFLMFGIVHAFLKQKHQPKGSQQSFQTAQIVSALPSKRFLLPYVPQRPASEIAPPMSEIVPSEKSASSSMEPDADVLVSDASSVEKAAETSRNISLSRCVNGNATQLRQRYVSKNSAPPSPALISGQPRRRQTRQQTTSPRHELGQTRRLFKMSKRPSHSLPQPRDE